jgi:DNA topoisomerase I, bacterial
LKNLVIVESPAKGRTIKKYLGKDFDVMASYGHVRDLVPKEGAVDPDHDFAMKYELIEKNQKRVQAIAQAAKHADALYLATDPDREGEAISWHLCEILRQKKVLDKKPVHRVVFHEITARAINEAVENPRALSLDLVNAQQARRALDYLVGFNLSPLLWKKIRRGLSAGRVQSPALRLIVEREEEIKKFKRREYWTIEADAAKDDQGFTARLVRYQGKKLPQFAIDSAEQASAVERELRDAAHGILEVSAVTKRRRRRHPPLPFMTSTLQQEASRKLGLSAHRIMRLAQQLYEGVDVGSGSVGLITYMRTDSVNLASIAVEEIRAVITERHGASKLPAKPHVYKTKAKNAQEAHEAIRPTSAATLPESLKDYLSTDQLKLYELIWKRTVACQMIHATIDTVTVDLDCGPDHQFRATGSRVVEPGFMAVYQESQDDVQSEGDERILPALAKGERVKLIRIRPEQHFTEPPPRYSEASLVKVLEEYGIGRPSTYATILSTLLQREYAVLEKRCFKPTDVGRVVNKFLTEHFTQYVDYEFTARLEDELDAVSRGEQDWIPLMRRFWRDFKGLVDNKDESLSRREVTHEALDEQCPKCNQPLTIRLGRRGRFIGCTGFPACDYTRSLGEEKQSAELQFVEDRSCPKCASLLVIRQGRYGKFIGCSNYPECKHIEPLKKPKDTQVICPQCHKSMLLERRSRTGKTFYSCSSYPSCNYALWNEPVADPCPTCAWPIMTLKTTKRRGTEKVCPHCKHAAPYMPGDEEADVGKAMVSRA